MLDERTDLQTAPLPKDQADRSPATYLDKDLSPDELRKLGDWVHDHYTEITTQMGPTLTRFANERAQHEGKMPGADYPYPGAFRVNYPVTKKKVRELSNRLKQAYLDSDPIWALDTEAELLEIAQQMESAIDQAVRNHLDADEDFSQAIFESALHGMGALAVGWLYQEDVQRDVEAYRGFDGLTQESLADLQRFEATYPNWKDEPEARKLHAKIAGGHDTAVEVSYTAPIHNRPNFEHIPAENLRVYPDVDGYEGLRQTPVYGYLREYTQDQLVQLARDEVIWEDALETVIGKRAEIEKKERSAVDDTETYEVFIATVRYALPGDTRPATYKVWWEVDSRTILRVRPFPWWLSQPDLIPLYVRLEDVGFFKRGLAWDLTDDHVVSNVLLNLFLNAVDMANSMRWKVKKNSLAERYLLLRKWSPHLPMPYATDPDEAIPNQVSMAHLPSIVQGFELIRRNADENTQTSSLQSGRESPTDPRAPAAKTALLLQQVEPNLKEHLRSMEPGFRAIGKWVLWLYYQGMSLGWVETLPGLEAIPRELLPELAKKLNPRALLFEFDRNGRTERNLQVVELLSKLAPMAVPEALKITLSQVDSQWARVTPRLNLNPPMPQGAPEGQPGSPPAAGPGDSAPNSSNGNGRQDALAALGAMMGGGGGR